jgi:predicted small secreted protein
MKLLVSFFIVSMLAACGTVSGLGNDLKGASDWTRDKISGSSVDLGK